MEQFPASNSDERGPLEERPEDDPEIKKIEETVLARTNKDIADMQAGKQGVIAQRESTDTYGETWQRQYARVAMQEWDTFITTHPDIAKKYREKLPEIDAAYKRKELRKSQ